MKLGIISAVENELAPILNVLEGATLREKAGLKIYEGRIEGVEAAAVVCGVCKVNAAMTAQILIDFCSADIIINCGTAGGMDPCLGIFDTVIATEVGYHDVDFMFLRDYHPHFDKPYFDTDASLIKAAKQAAEKLETGGKIHFGRMMTGEAFISDEGRPEINRLYSPMSVDMETAAIAHVCKLNNIPFISVRSITDTADHSGVGEFEDNCRKASVVSKDVTLSIIRELNK